MKEIPAVAVNSRTRFDEHEKLNGKYDPQKHLINKIKHEFSWTVVTRALSNCLKRKIAESYFIKNFKSDL